MGEKQMLMEVVEKARSEMSAAQAGAVATNDLPVAPSATYASGTPGTASDGGGAGVNNNIGGNGSPNTGGGGGGGAGSKYGGNGGSGIVIIRYRTN